MRRDKAALFQRVQAPPGESPPRSAPPALAVECGKKPVAEVLDLAAAKSRQLLTHNLVMPVDQRTPWPVAQGRRALCRVDNIGE